MGFKVYEGNKQQYIKLYMDNKDNLIYILEDGHKFKDFLYGYYCAIVKVYYSIKRQLDKEAIDKCDAILNEIYRTLYDMDEVTDDTYNIMIDMNSELENIYEEQEVNSINLKLYTR